MSRISIHKDTFRDKVMGCWLGKNAGGTLGEPLEGKFGQDEMFQVDWYPDLPEGGIPNDDLELQLIWLQLLMEKGPGISSKDFAQAWMDCVAYNFDEYGLSKENMQKGLLPPVCGWHNNAFKDCMGSPIRSEIWACLAPGCPEVAAWYAFQDAIVDHGGGESVYGEIFNAVLESAAFVNNDKFELLELALNSIPSECLTSQCVRKSIENYHAGMSYQDNRNDLKDSFYNPVAQYSPLNLGFQTIGWLYGESFGDSICKAVNCGWDTDCTAATLGAILGIIGGASSLPKKWIEPLGYEIATNMTTGGIRNLTAPTNIYELTDNVCEQAERVCKYWGCDVEFSEINEMTKDRKLSIPRMPWLDTYCANEICYQLGGLHETVAYGKDAAIIGNRTSAVIVRLENCHPIEKRALVELILPDGFSCVNQKNEKIEVEFKPQEIKELCFEIIAQEAAIKEINRLWLTINVQEEPAIPAIPLVLLGGSKWLISPLYAGKTLQENCGIDELCTFEQCPKEFEVQWNPGNRLNLEERFKENGVVYALHHIYSEDVKDVVLGVPNNGKMKLFLNGKMIHETVNVVPVRANLGNGGAKGDLNNYKVTRLEAGWNQILIKFEMVMTPQDSHFTIGGMSNVCIKNHGMPVLGLKRNLFSWEV